MNGPNGLNTFGRLPIFWPVGLVPHRPFLLAGGANGPTSSVLARPVHVVRLRQYRNSKGDQDNMLPTTREAVAAILKSDPTLDPGERARLLGLWRDGAGKESVPGPTEPRILRRAAAAERLGVRPRTLDGWAAAGVIRKVRLPGHLRSCGFSEADVAALITGRAT